VITWTLTIVVFLRQVVAAEKEEKFAKGSLNVPRIRGMLELVQCELPIKPEDLDSHPYLLNCLNGTLDLQTGELRKHRREDYLTKLVPFGYKPDAKCPKFLEFLNQIMGSTPDSSESALNNVDQLVDYLQKAFGYACTGDVSEKKIFALLGGGNNGKTTLLEAVRHVLSEYSTQILIDSLMSHRSRETNTSSADLADLFGARFATTSEGEHGQRLAEAKLKYLTAGMGAIKSCRKYENPIEFPATHKLFIDSNYKPNVRGTDTAIWERLKPIPFNVTIPKEQIDRNLLEKLKAEAEGVLAWLVEGCLKWQKEGLTSPDSVISAVTDWQQENDPLKDFVADCCFLDKDLLPDSWGFDKEFKESICEHDQSDLFCQQSVISESYSQWAKKTGEKFPLNRQDFTKRIEALGCKRSTRMISPPGLGKRKRQRVWEEIGLKEKALDRLQ